MLMLMLMPLSDQTLDVLIGHVRQQPPEERHQSPMHAGVVRDGITKQSVPHTQVGHRVRRKGVLHNLAGVRHVQDIQQHLTRRLPLPPAGALCHTVAVHTCENLRDGIEQRAKRHRRGVVPVQEQRIDRQLPKLAANSASPQQVEGGTKPSRAHGVHCLAHRAQSLTQFFRRKEVVFIASLPSLCSEVRSAVLLEIFAGAPLPLHVVDRSRLLDLAIVL
mmetsp:Transcript_3969/g.6732  ORF Transcript_3969/g.6732 Transcript_3969/m.6732 type:complete len:219 (+) Transcript_3969:3-659(+)